MRPKLKLSDLSRLPANRLLIVAGWLGLATFCVGSFITWMLWRALTLAGISDNAWNALGAVGTMAGFALTLAGALVILVQLNESIERRGMELFSTAFEQLSSEADITARRWIFINLPDDVEEGLKLLEEKPEGKAHVKRVLNSFDYMGFLLSQNWDTEDSVVHWVSPFVAKAWCVLAPYVDYEAQIRGEPDYYEMARFLGERCIQWRKERYPNWDPRRRLKKAL